MKDSITSPSYSPDDSRYCKYCKCIMAFNDHRCVNEGRTH